MKEMLRRFRDGGRITDSDLDAILSHYHILTMHLAHHGDIYRVVYVDALKEFDRGKEIYLARNNETWKYN